MRTAVEHHMGTAISIAAPDDADPALFQAAAAAAFAELRRADEVFSPFKADSLVSRLRDGRLAFPELGAEPAAEQIREVLALCARLNRDSRGAFDAFAVGDPPAFDPSGAVKGWAAQRASILLTEHGLTRHVLNAGGDVRVVGGKGPASDAGAEAASEPWRIAIADPHRPGRVLTVVERADGAVATSGTAERGAHVWTPQTRSPATALASVTVTGPDLALADGYATAALAMAGPRPAAAAAPAAAPIPGSPPRPAGGARPLAGTRRLLEAYDWLSALARDEGYEAFTVDALGKVWWTAGFPDLAPDLAETLRRIGSEAGTAAPHDADAPGPGTAAGPVVLAADLAAPQAGVTTRAVGPDPRIG